MANIRVQTDTTKLRIRDCDSLLEAISIAVVEKGLIDLGQERKKVEVSVMDEGEFL